MKKLLLLLCFLAATAQAGTVIVPAPIIIGRNCTMKFGERVMVNLSSITVFKYYDDTEDYRWYRNKTVLFTGDRSVQITDGNNLAAIEARLKECDKP